MPLKILWFSRRKIFKYTILRSSYPDNLPPQPRTGGKWNIKSTFLKLLFQLIFKDYDVTYKQHYPLGFPPPVTSNLWNNPPPPYSVPPPNPPPPYSVTPPNQLWYYPPNPQQVVPQSQTAYARLIQYLKNIFLTFIPSPIRVLVGLQ